MSTCQGIPALEPSLPRPARFFRRIPGPRRIVRGVAARGIRFASRVFHFTCREFYSGIHGNFQHMAWTLQQHAGTLQRHAVLLDELETAMEMDGCASKLRDRPTGLDELYAALEEKSRGSREDVKDRLRCYLPLLTEAGLGTATMPIIDLGCGRGEWLEILRENNLTGRGVELNEVFVRRCQALDLSVSAGDALDYLRETPSASIGAVTLIHVIEHFPFETLVQIFDEAARVLRPGGLTLVETPDPQQELASTRLFFAGRTHRNPIPRSVLQLLAENRGLQRVSTWPVATPEYALTAWKI
jgi:SAM-dependent methyltransferase